MEKYEKKIYPSAISHLERAVAMYPKPIGRFHLILGKMYLENGQIDKARNHALRAQDINPFHESTEALLSEIDALKSD